MSWIILELFFVKYSITDAKMFGAVCFLVIPDQQ